MYVLERRLVTPAVTVGRTVRRSAVVATMATGRGGRSARLTRARAVMGRVRQGRTVRRTTTRSAAVMDVIMDLRLTVATTRAASN